MSSLNHKLNPYDGCRFIPADTRPGALRVHEESIVRLYELRERSKRLPRTRENLAEQSELTSRLFREIIGLARVRRLGQVVAISDPAVSRLIDRVVAMLPEPETSKYQRIKARGVFEGLDDTTSADDPFLIDGLFDGEDGDGDIAEAAD